VKWKKQSITAEKPRFAGSLGTPRGVSGGTGDGRFAQCDERNAQSVLRNVASDFPRRADRVTPNTTLGGRKKGEKAA